MAKLVVKIGGNTIKETIVENKDEAISIAMEVAKEAGLYKVAVSIEEEGDTIIVEVTPVNLAGC